MFESDSPLIEMLKKEFNEVFEFLGDDKKASFLKKLDHILVNKRVQAQYSYFNHLATMN